MVKKGEFVNNFIKKIMNQEKEASKSFLNTQLEINNHKEKMNNNREKFKLIRNK
ncbi:hypothetical protein [Bacillus velezensis]|uniref:hypothetical protein n=1 Tax=Bacillus velezensis TaxID=492670 RepID=UPI00255BE0A2|nr:hypothetical protein [Bacillus velezensis]MDL5023340.1 hypothetical protein [Bacillus velezensis]